jgi:hypothetical protein
MGTLQIIDATGDTQLVWDVEAPETVECSREKFEELLTQGYMAVNFLPTGKEIIREFDQTATRILMLPAVRGG